MELFWFCPECGYENETEVDFGGETFAECEDCGFKISIVIAGIE